MSLPQSKIDREHQGFVETALGVVARRTQDGRLNTVYDSAEFSVSNGTSDYDVSSNQANAFSNVSTATTVSLRTDATVTVKFNSTSNHGITVTSTDSPLEVDTLEVTNIYISNSSGGAAAIKLLLT